MNRYCLNAMPLNNNCGIVEIGAVSSFQEEEVAPTDDEWFDALLADSVHDYPIVVFSYNKNQTLKSAEPYNIYHFGEWLKSKGETITVTAWMRNKDSRIQMATWIPSKKFKSKAARVNARFVKEDINSY